MNRRIAMLWRSGALSAVRSVFDKRSVETAVALYSVQAARFLIPLLMVPYLARVLGPETWGGVMFVQAIGLYLMIFVAYCFDLSATRDVARNREDRQRLGDIVSGVLGAQIVLCVVTAGLILVAFLVVPTLRDLGWTLGFGAVAYIAMAVRPAWFFLGLERVRVITAIDVGSRLLALVGIFVLVKSPSDAWMVFALQAAGAAISLLIEVMMIYRTVPFKAPGIAATFDTLRQGLKLFIFRASTGIYDMSNTIILGFLATPVAVGFYASAERILHMLYSVIVPVTQALFPRASKLVRDDPKTGARMARITTLTLLAITLAGSAVLYLAAPMFIRLLLGDGYSEVVPVLRILLLVLVINSVSTPLAHHWLIPSGLDGMMTKITVAGGIIHVPLAILLAAQFSYIGISWAYVITETFILAMMIGVPLVRGLGPFRLRTSPERIELEAT